MTNDRRAADTVGLPKMLNSTQVGKALGVNPSTLSRWRSQGIGPRVYWLGKACPRYREDDVRDWLERNAA
jgi:predicted DNA-binding transcriptional regulator AlpA